MAADFSSPDTSRQVNVDMADGTDSCAPSVLVPTEPEDGVEKLCGVCKVTISIHVGKPGVGKCPGGAFTKAFETLVKSVQGISSELQTERSEARKEREEAKDREVRNTQLRELRNEVSNLKLSFSKKDASVPWLRARWNPSRRALLWRKLPAPVFSTQKKKATKKKTQ